MNNSENVPEAKEVIRNYPEVTSRGIFMLTVLDVKNTVFFGKHREYKVAVYEATVNPKDPEFVHLLYIVFDPADVLNVLINTYTYLKQELSLTVIMSNILGKIDSKLKDLENGIY